MERCEWLGRAETPRSVRKAQQTRVSDGGRTVVNLEPDCEARGAEEPTAETETGRAYRGREKRHDDCT